MWALSEATKVHQDRTMVDGIDDLVPSNIK